MRTPVFSTCKVARVIAHSHSPCCIFHASSEPTHSLTLQTAANAGKAGFRAVAGDGGAIDPEEVEGLAAQLLGSSLNDAILDVVIDMTDDLDAVNVRIIPQSLLCLIRNT